MTNGSSPPPASGSPTEKTIRMVDLLGTAVFAASALAGVVIDGTAVTVYVAVSGILFVLGTVAMLVAFLWGVNRSRTEEISVAGLFLLMGSSGRPMQRLLLGLVLVQIAISVIAASIRPFTGLAFGILVPMYGLGLAGVYGARHGQFKPREKLDHKRPDHARPGQGETHG